VYMSRRLAATPAAKPPPSSNNTAFCVKTGSGATTGGGQTCTISQSGSGQNTAGVYENTQKMSGLSQSAQYGASITQQSSGSGNIACVTQNISLDGSTSNTNTKPVTVSLEANQLVTITQDSPAGNNSAQQAATSTGACDTHSTAIAQSQTLTSTVTTKGSITQSENPTTPSATLANVVIEIDQNQGTSAPTGSNAANFTQTINQTAIANTPNGPVTQTQSSPDNSFPFSGGVGTVNQTTTSGTSTATTTQNEYQCEDAATGGLTTCTTGTGDADFSGSYPLMQNQYGPEGVFKAPAHSNRRVPSYHKGYGKATQTGGNGDTFNIIQFSQQDADSGSNQHNTLEADCLTPGTCTVQQTTDIDGKTTGPVTNSGQDLSNITITCTGSECASTEPQPLSFSWVGTGASAGWECQAGGPIELTVGSPSDTTNAQITINNVGNVTISNLPEPTFATDNYGPGSPRYYITLSDGHTIWGYPPNSGLNGSDFGWAIDNGSSYPSWSVIQSGPEGSATVTGAFVIADGDQAPGTTDLITNLTFNGTNFNPDPCNNPLQ
jgi:hypothetical protein